MVAVYCVVGYMCMRYVLSAVFSLYDIVTLYRYDIDIDMVARTCAPVAFRTADNLVDLANPSYIGEPPYTGAWKGCAYDPDKPPQAAPGGLYSTDQVKVDVSLVEVVRAWSKDVIRGGLTDEAAIVAFSRDWFRQRAEQGVVAPSGSRGGESARVEADEALLLKAEEQRKREAAATAAAAAEAAAAAAAAAEAAATAEAAAAAAAAATAAARRAKEDVVAAQAREAEAAVAAAAREAAKANADADADAAAAEIVESTATAEAARLAVEAEAAAAVDAAAVAAAAAAAAEAEAEAEAEARVAAAADAEHQAKLAAWEAAVATVRAVAQGGGSAQSIAAAAVAQLQVGAPEVRPHAATVAIRSDEQPGSLLVLASTADGLVGEIWGDGDAEGATAGGDAEGAAEGAARCAATALALLAGGDVTAAGGTAAGGGPAAVALREARDGYVFGALLSGSPGVPPEFLAMMAAALSECIERAWRRARLDALLEVAKEWVSDVCEGEKRLTAVEWVPDETGAAASSIDLKGGAALVLTDKSPASPPGDAAPLGTIVAICKEGAELNGYIVDLLEVT